jgi:hypothetical protein
MKVNFARNLLPVKQIEMVQGRMEPIPVAALSKALVACRIEGSNPEGVNVCVYVCVCVCVCVCVWVWFSVIKWNNNPLHIRRVGRKGQTKKKKEIITCVDQIPQHFNDFKTTVETYWFYFLQLINF